MRSRPVPLSVLVAVACAAALAGCSAGGVASRVLGTTTSPRPAVDVTVIPTLAATTAASAPTMPVVMQSPTPPPEMARDDEAGAVAAATYFLTELYPYTISSQQTAALAEISHPDCQFCQSTFDTVASEIAAGQVTHPGALTVTKSEVTAVNPLVFAVTLSIEQAPDTLWSSAEGLLGSSSQRRLNLEVFILRQGNYWMLRGVDAVGPTDNST